MVLYGAIALDRIRSGHEKGKCLELGQLPFYGVNSFRGMSIEDQSLSGIASSPIVSTAFSAVGNPCNLEQL